MTAERSQTESVAYDRASLAPGLLGWRLLLAVQFGQRWSHAAPIVAVLEDRGDPRHITELCGQEAAS